MKRITAKRQDRLFKRRLISVAVMSAVSGHLNANPTGPQVVNGQVSVASQGSVLTVTAPGVLGNDTDADPGHDRGAQRLIAAARMRPARVWRRP